MNPNTALIAKKPINRSNDLTCIYYLREREREELTTLPRATTLRKVEERLEEEGEDDDDDVSSTSSSASKADACLIDSES